MEQKRKYESPEVGTIFPLRSKYAEEFRIDLLRKVAFVLENEGLIPVGMAPREQSEGLRIRLDDYLNKSPRRKHENNWIDGGKQVAVFHPDTFLPFFPNKTGSEICRLCNGKHTIGEMIGQSKRKWRFETEEILTKDLMKFLLLLEELDLIEFKG